jgi:hypothetical protein
MKRIALWLFPIFILCVGCSNGYLSESSNSAKATAESAPTQSPRQDAFVTAENHRDVVKSGSLTVQVGNVTETEKKVRVFVASSGGRVDKVSSDNLAAVDATIDMLLKVPVDHFETLMAQLEGTGIRTRKSVQAADVTQQVFENGARLSDLEAKALQARSGPDLQAIQSQIRQMRADQKALVASVTMSTLELTMQQNPTAASIAGQDPNWLQTSWAGAWGSGMYVFRSGVALLMWVLVFAPIWLPSLLVLKWLVRLANPPKSASKIG